MTNEDKSLIPNGLYCYTYDEYGKFVICPYWDKWNDKPEQENGYCKYLKKGDWDFDDSISLLWDQVKECGINDEGFDDDTFTRN